MRSWEWELNGLAKMRTKPLWWEQSVLVVMSPCLPCLASRNINIDGCLMYSKGVVIAKLLHQHTRSSEKLLLKLMMSLLPKWMPMQTKLLVPDLELAVFLPLSTFQKEAQVLRSKKWFFLLRPLAFCNLVAELQVVTVFVVLLVVSCSQWGVY